MPAHVGIADRLPGSRHPEPTRHDGIAAGRAAASARRRTPRRRRRAALAALAVALAAGCASLGGGPFTVDSEGDPQARFETLAGWDWLPAPPASGDLGTLPAPIVDERVREAVAAALAARGHPRTPAAPSFWVHPMASVEDVVAVEARDYYAQVPPWMRDALRDTHAIVGQRGVLVVDVVDPATRRLLWRGVVSGVVDPSASPDQRRRRLDEAVRLLLERFPPD